MSQVNISPRHEKFYLFGSDFPVALEIVISGNLEVDATYYPRQLCDITALRKVMDKQTIREYFIPVAVLPEQINKIQGSSYKLKAGVSIEEVKI